MGMPVCLATIPEARTSVRTPDGLLEGYLTSGSGPDVGLAPIGLGRGLVDYIQAEACYDVVQHGCHHDIFEFGGSDRRELARRLDRGARALSDAGFQKPHAFVAPYDRMSRGAFVEVGARFDVISTGWFEAGRVPARWWAAYALRKLGRQRHWRAGGCNLLSHPGCLLSYHRARAGMMDSVRDAIEGASLTVLVSHWWEFFRGGIPDDELIGTIHEVADWISSRSDIQVVTFSDVAGGRVPLN